MALKLVSASMANAAKTSYFLSALTMLAICNEAYSQHQAISCSDYEYNLQWSTLDKIIPSNLRDEERCQFIPDRCGPTGLLFNGKGIQTYYYRSECYFKLAVMKHDERICDRVLERKSLLLDGSYYSSEECRRAIARDEHYQNAPSIASDEVIKVVAVRGHIKNDGRLQVSLDFDSLTGAAGTYALSLSATYSSIGDTGKKTKNHQALNPISDRIKNNAHGVIYAVAPISQWILSLDPKILNHKSLEIEVSSSEIAKILATAEEKSFSLKADLQFLESNSGSIPDPTTKNGYLSSASTVVLFDEQKIFVP